MRQLTRRQFAGLAALAPVVCTVGCAPWEWQDPATAPDRLVEGPLPTPWERRVLDRIGFGPRPGDVKALRDQGIDAYVAQQLTPETIEENPELGSLLAECDTLEMDPEEAHTVEQEWHCDRVLMPVSNLLFKFPRPYPPQELHETANELARATVLRAVYSRRQLLEVMVEFWTDHFNIDQSKADCRWLKTIDDGEIRRHALGKFRDLLMASAHSPAMLVYLDNASNRKYDPLTKTPPNENYARELLELHTLGDTSAYTLGDIQQVAKCFTGWSVEGEWQPNPGRFFFRAEDHDEGEKWVLGQRIPPGQGEADGEMVIDLLASHPLTARTVSQKLCLYFVGDSPPAPLVDRLVEEYLRTGGDMRQILMALFSSDEFRMGSDRSIKRPFRFAISAMRALGVRTSGRELAAHLQAMGQRPFAWAMPDGYPTQSDVWASNLTPRWRFAISLAHGDIEETHIDYSSLERLLSRSDPAAVCQQLAQSLLGTALPAETLASLMVLAEPDRRAALPQWLALMLMSPEFQWCA
ncbi:MAG TPA: DUF1800 domain-containing protein [Pirellulales bacterium]|jgi:uncharacterized protein (DUF1800 family)|nr:DUF1800 domain-containing protein [Pirellulales bacterium]